MAKAHSPKRRQRGHDVLPAGFKWRDGRPRWEPSPSRRRLGWRGVDLKDAWGKWLAKGPAIERAEAIAKAVSAWVAGEPAPPAFAAIAPKGAVDKGATKAVLNPRSIGTLRDAYYASPGFSRLADKTQRDYKSKIGRLLEVIAAEKDAAKLAKKVAIVEALDIDILLPPAFDAPGDFELELAYETLRSEAGDSMAYGVLAATSAWLTWCVKKKRIWPTNPAALVERGAPDGRIVVYDWPEIVALVRAADALNLRSIGDAIILGLDLSWSQQDLLALNWGQVSKDGHVKHRRIKTGVAGNPPLLALGVARVAEILARYPNNVVPAATEPVLVCETTGRRWEADHFRHKFGEVRAAAAVDKKNPQPTVLERQFRDLRDTAVTYAYEAGLELQEICSRTLHKPERAQAVITKHYGSIRQAVADRAAEKLNAHFEKVGYSLTPLAALPAPAAEE